MGIYDRDYYRRETSGSLWLTGQAPVTLSLVAINVFVFLAQIFGPTDLTGSTIQGLLQLQTESLLHDWQIWRLVTATFCHGGIWHLVGNMLFLWWFGRELEMLYGSREFLIFYLVAGVFSSLAWAVVTALSAPARPVAMIGASGAVTAVTVLYTLHNPRHTILLYGIIPIEMRWMVLIYLGVDFYGLVGPQYSPIAHIAHLGGAAYAVIFKYADLRFGRLRRFSIRWNRPELRVHRPEPEPADPTPLDEGLEHRMDEVLTKIAKDGKQSLTDQERQILDEASRRLRSRRN